MVQATRAVLDRERGVWTGTAPFAAGVAAIDADVVVINEAIGQQQVETEGITGEKEERSDAAVDIGVRLAGFAVALAIDTDDDALEEQISVSRTRLDRMPDATLAPALRDMHARLRALGQVGRDYGITADGLAAFQTAIAAYEAELSSPRKAIAHRKTYTAAILPALRRIRRQLRKLDRLVRLFEGTAPVFVRDYFNARIIIDLGHRYRPQGPVPPQG